MMDSSEKKENLYGAPEDPPSPLQDHSTALHAGTENTLCSSRRTENDAVSSSSYADPDPPEGITVSQVSSESVSLQWDIPAEEVQSFLTTCSCEAGIVQEQQTPTNSVTFSGLQPGKRYLIAISAQLKNGRKRKAAETSVQTKSEMENKLQKMDLELFYPTKLSLSKVLQIDQRTITDAAAECRSDFPWCFLKKLMMANVTARNVKCTSGGESPNQSLTMDEDSDLEDLDDCSNVGEKLNALDMITTLFLCSDGFVHQEMALKMSLCQFPVPLLLPNCDTKQCTLMLWALRDIVKKYRPQSLSESKGFVEDRIVLSELPLISFVRLGKCSLSKSHILNKLLSTTEQNQEVFVHREMECGDSPRRISNGLTEITWYLPGGNKNMDVFSEPVAVANLRGDIASFETQYSFLCRTSTAVFVFFDNLDADYKLLTNQPHNAQIFLVCDQQSRSFNVEAFRKVRNELTLTNKIILRKTQMTGPTFVEKMKKIVKDVLKNSIKKIRIEQMVEVAHELAMVVDEDSTECQNGKKKADAITEEIQEVLKYKEDQLPRQGQIWKELSSLEKEEFRLRNAGGKDIAKYQSDLQVQKRKLRDKQNSYEISPAMVNFIHGLSSPGTERFYFLKWMQINLDNLSREKLSGLREQYKEKSKSSQNKEMIKDIDRQLCNSSLGTEHFFREMSQIYEASLVLPETNPSCQQLQHLPKLCAQLLLDGFPLELVDGDASNIPLRWVTDVLSQLNDLVAPKNKIMVVTVLGVQSTGKSTLLNTMFGVQFAVSSGRCTRGAFMLLIRVNEDVQKELKCDFVVIIDTEGLKSPELAQLDNSYEHDNELATLVVGLSDVTIINVAMENSTEMKDILQIVVHAFLRMKEVGKKPKCQFVHQNVSDVSAHDKNLRDRNLLLQQLDEMTQAAAKMEKKQKNKSFTDVMEYNPDTGNCYIPGLWNGNPPMAPVSAGYSEAVYELKKNIIQMFGKSKASSNNISEFTEWMSSLWNAVKHENFIFSFRNSLVAEAYMRLNSEFNKWEWDFKKHMYSWLTTAETRIKNSGTAADQSKSIRDLLTSLKSEASMELSQWEAKLQDNLTQYFEQTEGRVHLVERYKEDFANSAKSLWREMESSVLNQLTVAADIRQMMAEVEKIKKDQTKKIEEQVCALIDKCRKKKVRMTEPELDKEFDQMWEKTVNELPYRQQKVSNIFTDVTLLLRENLQHKGSRACQLLSENNLEVCGLEPFKYSPGLWHHLADKFKNLFTFKSHQMSVQQMSDSIIAACKQSVLDKAGKKSNYHNTYILEILHMIDEKLLNHEDLKTDIEFEVSLKMNICGDAARRFQKMHEDFIRLNDPHVCLNQNKEKFCSDFKDLFHERDQCQKKAEEFAKRCLGPAVEDFISRSLGPDIVGEMLKCKQFSTRMFFQHAIMLDLLHQDQFDKYLSYIRSYEDYVKSWILDQLLTHFSQSASISEFENRRIRLSIRSVQQAIEEAKTKQSGELKTFVEDVCEGLGDKLVISQDALGNVMTLNNADKEQFAHWLTEYVKDMDKDLAAEFKETNIKTKLKNLNMKPEDELFSRVIGCGKQCPFCKAPCDAGGKAHTEHWASLHRPQGLGGCKWDDTGKLMTDICSSAAVSDLRFHGSETKGEWHPYKQYTEIFPDWKIPPDVSLQASDYWKYVMAKFNDAFAQRYGTKPADIPETWKNLTPEEAEKSLNESFNVK